MRTHGKTFPITLVENILDLIVIINYHFCIPPQLHPKKTIYEYVNMSIETLFYSIKSMVHVSATAVQCSDVGFILLIKIKC